MMSAIKVIFYDKQEGIVPVQDFLRSLDAKMRAKVARAIDLLKANGA